MSRWKIHSDASGQAIAELMISLLALMCVFLGLLMVSALGIQNVQTLIHARENAEQSACNGIISQATNSILYWSYGNDGLLFTKDDGIITAIYDFPYRDGLISTDADTPSLQFNPITDYPDYLQHNITDIIQDSEVYARSARLSMGSVTVSNPLRERELEDLENAFGALFLNGKEVNGTNFSIQESVYIPVFNLDRLVSE